MASTVTTHTDEDIQREVLRELKWDAEVASDEIGADVQNGVATLITACSRVEGYAHRYVQHALEASADQVWEAMQQEAVVLVCGNASTMAPGVRAALIAVFRAKTGAGESDGEAWLAGLRTSDRYLEDIWGESAVV